MTIDEVIKAGQFSEDQIQALMNPDAGMTWMAWTVAIGIALFAIGILVWIFSDNWDESRFEQAFPWLSISLFIGVGLTWIGHSMATEWDRAGIERELADRWKAEVAMPYLKSLPKEQHEIVYMKISTAAVPTNVELWWNTGDITSDKLTALTVSYKLGTELRTETNWYNTSMTLANSDRPYVKYQFLSKDLGHGISAGQYNKTVNLPNDYRFTDIK